MPRIFLLSVGNWIISWKSSPIISFLLLFLCHWWIFEVPILCFSDQAISGKSTVITELEIVLSIWIVFQIKIEFLCFSNCTVSGKSAVISELEIVLSIWIIFQIKVEILWFSNCTISRMSIQITKLNIVLWIYKIIILWCSNSLISGIWIDTIFLWCFLGIMDWVAINNNVLAKISITSKTCIMRHRWLMNRPIVKWWVDNWISHFYIRFLLNKVEVNSINNNLSLPQVFISSHSMFMGMWWLVNWPVVKRWIDNWVLLLKLNTIDILDNH